MSADRPPRGFTEETNATPLQHLTDASAAGPRRPCLVMIAGPMLGEIFPINETGGELIVGRDPDAQLRLGDDESVSRRHAAVRSTGEGKALIKDLGSANGTYLDGARIDGEAALREGSKIRVGQTVVLKYALYDQLEELAQRQLLESALRDGLTHTFNRRYFVQRLQAEIRFAERHASTVGLMLIDIDHFKQLNDRYGHPAGDGVLKQLCEVLGETLRAEDVLARWGGEELSVLVRGIAREHAFGLADRLRNLVQATPFGASDSAEAISISVSMGLALYPLVPPRNPDETTDDAQTLIARAGDALQRAKQAGRNRVEV